MIRIFFPYQVSIVISCISDVIQLQLAQIVTKCFKICVLRKIAPNSIPKFMVIKNRNGENIEKNDQFPIFPHS